MKSRCVNGWLRAREYFLEGVDDPWPVVPPIPHPTMKSRSSGERRKMCFVSSFCSEKFSGFFGVFSNLSMFTWMSVMCWDLARTFGRLRPPSNRLQSKKFLYYSAFGWLLPLLFTIFCLILQLTTSKCSSWNPSIGTSSCFVDNDHPTRRLVFFHLPMFLLLLSNVAGFAFCLYHIRKTQRGARTASDSVETR